MHENLLYAFLLTLFAGAATGIGSLIAFVSKRTDEKLLSFALGLSAGVMIYVSFMELLYDARVSLTEIVGDEVMAMLILLAAFLGGILVAGIIDKLIPDAENPHELHSVEEMSGKRSEHHHSAVKYKRLGVVTAITIAIHNFPEGIATFMSGLDSVGVGVSIAVAVAVAIHNIPEGIAVSVPIYFATRSKRKAFWYSMASGLAEPLGAVMAYLLLMPFLTPILMQCIFAAVAGIMIYIALDELLPASHQYGHSHLAIYGVISGMVIMALSIIMMM